MRIALLSSDPEVVYGDGHACPARLRGLAHALVSAGHEVSLMVSGLEPGCADPGPELDLRVLRVPVSVREIDWHFSRVRPDIVIECHLSGSLEGAMAAAEAGVPHIYDLDCVPRAGLGTSHSVRGALPEALALSRGALVADEQAAGRVRALMGEGFDVHVLANAVGAQFLETPAHDQVARIERALRLAPGTPRIGCYGPLVRDGGLVPLVRALGLLPAEVRPRLVVIGDGPERNPALVAADEANVGLVLCGTVPRYEAPAYLALCGVVVTPDERDDGMPRAMLEAMAMHRAVVAPASEAARRVARHGHDAQLVAFDEPQVLADALALLLADAALRSRLGGQAHRTVVARHTWDTRIAIVERLVDRVRLTGGAAAAAWQPDGRSAGAER